MCLGCRIERIRQIVDVTTRNAISALGRASCHDHEDFLKNYNGKVLLCKYPNGQLGAALTWQGKMNEDRVMQVFLTLLCVAGEDTDLADDMLKEWVKWMHDENATSAFFYMGHEDLWATAQYVKYKFHEEDPRLQKWSRDFGPESHETVKG